MNLVLSGGGTGGHIMPALAIAQAALAEGFADSVAFVGAEHGLEKQIVSAAGFRIETLPVGRVRGMGWATRAAGLAGFAVSVPAAAALLKRFHADVVIGTGGYASAPTVLAGAALRRKVAVLEQNTIPGATTRLLSHVASVVCVSFPMCSGFLPSWKVKVTGNPVRPEIVAAAGRRARKGPPKKPGIVVLGGSQGALFLNVRLAQCLGGFARRHPEVRVIHQAGAGRGGEVGNAYENVKNAQVVGFIDDMASLLEGASLVIGRAGATTLAELTAIGVPSILVPFPQAVDKHQDWNARALQQAGAACVMFQDDFSEERFTHTLEELMGAPETLAEMETRARSLGRPAAAHDVLAAVGEIR